MFAYQHRPSKDIDLFGYDAQWLSLVSPRLNAKAAAVATDYVEQANAVKIVTERGDIGFVIAADVTHPVQRRLSVLAGRSIATDLPVELLAKKMLYRAAMFLPRDVYDLSAAIDLDPNSAREAVTAAASTRSILLKRLEALGTVPAGSLLSGVVPYDGPSWPGHGRQSDRLHPFRAYCRRYRLPGISGAVTGHRRMIRDRFSAIRNAVSNASTRPVSDVEIGAVLASGTGSGHVVRAVFGDCAVEVLVEAAEHASISIERFLVAYRTARSLHAAAHDGLDAMAGTVDQP